MNAAPLIGRRRSCYCGECPKCRRTERHREYMQRRRENGGKNLGYIAPWQPTPRPELTVDHAWLAGIIDGEGCITIRRKTSPTPAISLVVGMTDEATISRVAEIAGCGSIRQAEVRNRIKPLYSWAAYSHSARDVLWLLLPLLVTKHEQAAECVVDGGKWNPWPHAKPSTITVVSGFDEFLPAADPRPADWPEPLPLMMSPTALTTFLTCPEQFRRVYLQGERSRPSGSLLVGRADSTARETDLGQKITTGINMDVEDVKTVAAEAFDKEIDVEGGVQEVLWEKDDTPGGLKDLAVACAGAYRTQRSEQVQPIAVEKRVELAVPGMPALLHGYLDVEEGHVIREAKTANKAVSKATGGWLTQILLYTAATGKQAVFDVTNKKPKDGPVVLPEIMGPPAAGADKLLSTIGSTASEGIVGLLERRGPDQLWPGTGAVQIVSPCSWCDFRATCPLTN